jgi:hypothetical protein
VRLSATFVNNVCTIKIYNNLGGQVYQLLLFFHMQPANQPTITGVSLDHGKVGCPWLVGK